jgi:hypothetical protein
MDQMRLPFRLVPRKRSQIMPLLGFGFAFIFLSLMALVTAAEGTRIRLNGEVVTDPTVRKLLVLLCFACVLFCFCGIVAVAVKMIPRSPFFHINLSSNGIAMRRWFRQQSLSWSDASKFETLQVETESKRGTRINHYTVVMRPAIPPAEASGDGTYLEEVLRISADEYGAKSEEEDAAAMAEWLNALRTLALDRRLDGNSPIEVPDAFRSSVRPLAATSGSGTVERS